MNTEKAERLRAIADWIAKKGSPDFPTPTITNYIGFLLSLADEVENKPKWSHDSEGNYICNRCGHSDPGFVVSDEIWKKHSGSWHDRVLCVNCFYEMSDMVPTFRATKEQAADEESKPLELDADKAEGLSLRDHFAANAINGMIAGYDPQSKANGRFVPENDYPLLAEQSYQIADAMLNERTKKQSPLELSDLERFGVALLDWYFRDLKRENISTAVEHNTLKFFLQSPEFEKWSKETLKS